ncbi:hypothetical protein [Alicyclobacillus macrosporangiidus]|uniref:Uncharacterized protein n=1 Tax=Alicyclobacillus macrosporangiidus TaxID=392015 RepID=A0A1I7KBF0_9BACL|nr:hypothetical protein [Alicyclobacillus macrosporangiidus]SFU94773.1 hypothetical protein SAMN05421543_1153 [Alicyclobacillus macrosporangiidus]
MSGNVLTDDEIQRTETVADMIMAIPGDGSEADQITEIVAQRLRDLVATIRDLQRRNAELSKEVINRPLFERQIVGALRSTIDAHGMITKETAPSAAKRIIGHLKQSFGLMETWKQRADEANTQNALMLEALERIANATMSMGFASVTEFGNEMKRIARDTLAKVRGEKGATADVDA